MQTPAILGAGILTFFSPCVLPLIPMYLSALIGTNVMEIQGIKKGQLILNALLFSIGFILIFSLMGLGAGGISTALTSYKYLVQLIGGIIILLFGLKFLKLIDIPLLDRIINLGQNRPNRKVGLFSAFFMGILFAVGWSPCVGPVLGSVLTYTASKAADIPTAVWYLTAYGIGFAIPLLLTAVFAEIGIKFIRKASRFLPIFEKVMGIVLVMAAGTLLHGAVHATTSAPSIKTSKAPKGSTLAAADAAKSATPGKYPLVVEFYSKDCSICKKMAPLMEKLKQECNGNKVEIRQIDISAPENSHFVQDFRIIGVPTFVMLERDGDEIARMIGEQDEKSLRQAISALRGEPCPGVDYIDPNFLFDKSNAKPQANCGAQQQTANCETSAQP